MGLGNVLKILLYSAERKPVKVSESFNHSSCMSRQDISGNLETGSNTHSRQIIGEKPLTDSLSGISSFQLDKNVAGKFEGVLYHVLASGMKVNIRSVSPYHSMISWDNWKKSLKKSSWIPNKFSDIPYSQGRKVLF